MRKHLDIDTLNPLNSKPDSRIGLPNRDAMDVGDLGEDRIQVIWVFKSGNLE